MKEVYVLGLHWGSHSVAPFYVIHFLNGLAPVSFYNENSLPPLRRFLRMSLCYIPIVEQAGDPPPRQNPYPFLHPQTLISSHFFPIGF